jgi:hypothetical protein
MTPSTKSRITSPAFNNMGGKVTGSIPTVGGKKPINLRTDLMSDFKSGAGQLSTPTVREQLASMRSDEPLAEPVSNRMSRTSVKRAKA